MEDEKERVIRMNKANYVEAGKNTKFQTPRTQWSNARSSMSSE